MKNKIVEDGPSRFFRAKKNAGSFESIYEKYAPGLAKASPDEKKKIQEQMRQEISLLERAQNHQPSARTL